MNPNNPYYRQVQLLVQLLPLVAEEPCFALKGGTAINLFVREFPRLSVDIDLVYLPADERAVALQRIAEALDRVAERVMRAFPGTRLTKGYEGRSDALRLIVERASATVKIELSPVLRGTVYPPRMLAVVAAVEREFGFAEVPVVAFEDLYAGKICAAIDRQHPRDLFDVMLLMNNEGLTENLRKAFLVYLVSHPRPMEELLAPTLKPLAKIYAGEFQGMALRDVSLTQLEDVRTQLVETISASLADADKAFLCAVYEGDPDASMLGLAAVMELPAVKWKLHNVARMPAEKRFAAAARLRSVLGV